jgi:hypothetical protein
MPAQRYFSIPTPRRQLTAIAVSVLAYGLLVGFGDFYFTDLSGPVKKKLTQLGLVLLYIASLCAGLTFVWSSKARHNVRTAEITKEIETEQIALLKTQEQLLNRSFSQEISRRQEEIKEAVSQIKLAEDLPKVYEYSGAASLILVAIGTALCFIGAG